jgi:hypothetical protein
MTKGPAQAGIKDREEQSRGANDSREAVLTHTIRLRGVLCDGKCKQKERAMPVPFEGSGRP